MCQRQSRARNDWGLASALRRTGQVAHRAVCSLLSGIACPPSFPTIRSTARLPDVSGARRAGQPGGRCRRSRSNSDKDFGPRQRHHRTLGPICAGTPCTRATRLCGPSSIRDRSAETVPQRALTTLLPASRPETCAGLSHLHSTGSSSAMPPAVEPSGRLTFPTSGVQVVANRRTPDRASLRARQRLAPHCIGAGGREAGPTDPAPRSGAPRGKWTCRGFGRSRAAARLRRVESTGPGASARSTSPTRCVRGSRPSRWPKGARSRPSWPMR